MQLRQDRLRTNHLKEKPAQVSFVTEGFFVGPGSYQSLRSDFSKTLATKGIGEVGSYLLNDNGHINQRT